MGPPGPSGPMGYTGKHGSVGPENIDYSGQVGPRGDIGATGYSGATGSIVMLSCLQTVRLTLLHTHTLGQLSLASLQRRLIEYQLRLG